MRLRCEECGRPSGPEARGWRICHASDPDDASDEFVLAYCETCWVREFGETKAERKEAE